VFADTDFEPWTLRLPHVLLVGQKTATTTDEK
jgi:hypothetical protein